jgi:nucleoside phosphorylase
MATVRGVLLAAALLAATLSGIASARADEPSCPPRILVLSAMPLELEPLLASATVDPADVVRIDDRTFYPGQLAGHDVVLAMTGIGMVNAAETTTAALEHFACGFDAAVFSGVAGSQAFIGDVIVPSRWTLDAGATWIPVDPEMLSVASHLQGTDVVPLARDVPVGDATCLCPGVEPGVALPVQVPYLPKVRAGFDGRSEDTFGDHALPCVPGGGDVAGCEPCLAPGSTPADVAAFAAHAPPMADPSFFESFTRPPTTDASIRAQDMETAAFGAVAAAHGVPFLGIRGVSDGRGDPLGLPGFPFQFFAYRDLAGDNAAATTIAFLEAWPG